MYSLVDVTESEYDLLLPIWESAVRATHYFLKEEDIESIKAALIKDYFPAVKLVCLKNEKENIIGFTGVHGDKLEMLFVDASVHGCGFGKILLQHAVKNLGITKVDVNEQNEQAIGFYKKYGFYVIKRNELDGEGRPYPILEMGL